MFFGIISIFGWIASVSHQSVREVTHTTLNNIVSQFGRNIMILTSVPPKPENTLPIFS
jgi:hypothetical protein